ncbi:MAG: Fe-S cluster assembly protein SufB [Candidatus Yonathbacteria bacterium]|nr:Fe-S cluster assembly protein SufB [Candidatus Yonathbacteria bacterium]
MARITGLSERLVRHISDKKDEPGWMLEKRLKAFSAYEEMKMPGWGPSLEGLNLDDIVFYADPKSAEARSWDDVPAEVKETFDALGIPQAEREHLAGVGAQYDAHSVYHHIKETLEHKGIMFMDMDRAVREHPELIREYFMTVVPHNDHIFAAIHGAVWSGGTFVYVPAGVTVPMPLQSYFWMQARKSGQFEHTLIIAEEGASLEYIEGCGAPQYAEHSLHAGSVEVIVKDHAHVRYTSIENWSKNTYNLNTKRAIVGKNASVHWVGGNMGAGVTMLYPTSILNGRGGQAHHVSIAFAGKDQVQDTGGKVIHNAPDTASTVHARSFAHKGGVSIFRGLVDVGADASGAVSATVCDSLLLDDMSRAESYPAVKSSRSDVSLSHEARIGTIGEEELFYARSRGLSEADATRLIVGGFIKPVAEALPVEYALELQKLLDLELKDSVKRKKKKVAAESRLPDAV